MFIFAWPILEVHQCLDYPLMSFAFRWLELAIAIIAKPTVVGITIIGTMLLA
jgi:hypothetical protein